MEEDDQAIVRKYFPGGIRCFEGKDCEFAHLFREDPTPTKVCEYCRSGSCFLGKYCPIDLPMTSGHDQTQPTYEKYYQLFERGIWEGLSSYSTGVENSTDVENCTNGGNGIDVEDCTNEGNGILDLPMASGHRMNETQPTYEKYYQWFEGGIWEGVSSYSTEVENSTDVEDCTNGGNGIDVEKSTSMNMRHVDDEKCVEKHQHAVPFYDGGNTSRETSQIDQTKFYNIFCKYFFTKGGCTSGKRCRFSHVLGDNQEPPIIVCKRFLRGRCPNKKVNCRYEHQVPIDSFVARRAQMNKNVTCRFYLSKDGCCDAACKFSHAWCKKR